MWRGWFRTGETPKRICSRHIKPGFGTKFRHTDFHDENNGV